MYEVFRTSTKCRWNIYRTSSKCHWSIIAHKHDDVIKWKHFPRYWPFVREIHRSPVNFPHKGQWRGALMFTLICARINGWVNNHEAGDLRRNRAHCDVTVMMKRRGTLRVVHKIERVYPRRGLRSGHFPHCVESRLSGLKPSAKFPYGWIPGSAQTMDQMTQFYQKLICITQALKFTIKSQFYADCQNLESILLTFVIHLTLEWMACAMKR